MTKLIKEKQPQLYQYLLKMRDKKAVKQLVNLENKQPFVYVSGQYSAEFEKATVAFPLTSGRNGNVLVYDLRHDPTPLLELSVQEIEKKLYAKWEERQAEGFVPVPVKELQYNRAPAVAPLGVLAQENGWEKLQLTEELITKHRNILLSSPAFAENLRTIYEKRPEFKKSQDAEAQLYDGFLPEMDAMRVSKVRQASEQQLADLHPDFTDERLSPLLLHYKARNFPRSLSEDEVGLWEAWRGARIKAQLPEFIARLQDLGAKTQDESKQFVLQELQLWAESIVPIDEE